jgi:hypothetical protein
MHVHISCGRFTNILNIRMLQLMLLKWFGWLEIFQRKKIISTLMKIYRFFIVLFYLALLMVLCLTSEIGCRSDSECPAQKACINDHCQDPCDLGPKCPNSQQCIVQNHQQVCVQGNETNLTI